MSKPRSRLFWPVLALLVLLVIAACGLLGFTTCNPPDRVDVTVKNIPSDTRFLSLAASSDRGAESMAWSPEHLWSKLNIHPKNCTMSYRFENDPPRLDGYPLRWRFGDKYGVVMQTQKGEWRAAWFPAADVPLKGRTVFGGGEATFDLSKAEVVPLDADTVKALGLQDVKPMK